MIPKIIHYCWFGGQPLPQSAIECISSWKKYFSDYQIIEWNEQNYDCSKNAYIKEAYEAKKYAFVSDYARFDILYKYGGIYFDTDVEVVENFQNIVDIGPFMGQEAYQDIQKGNTLFIAPGLGMGAIPGMEVFNTILQKYNHLHFIQPDGNINTITVCEYITEIMKSNGYDCHSASVQNINGISIYPAEYFCPLNHVTGKLCRTKNTKTIHWYGATWMGMDGEKKSSIRRSLVNKYGSFWGYVLFKIYNIFKKIESIMK